MYDILSEGVLYDTSSERVCNVAVYDYCEEGCVSVACGKSCVVVVDDDDGGKPTGGRDLDLGLKGTVAAPHRRDLPLGGEGRLSFLRVPGRLRGLFHGSSLDGPRALSLGSGSSSDRRVSDGLFLGLVSETLLSLLFVVLVVLTLFTGREYVEGLL